MDIRNKKIWDKIRTNPAYKPLIDMLMADYDKVCKDQEIPMILFSQERRFTEEGDRADFEKTYFMRREQLSVYAMLALIYPENDKYLKKLEDLICEICCEYSWALPMHRPLVFQNQRDTIDLFAAETGLYLTEIKYLLIDRLHPMVVNRMTNEIKYRIIDSIKKNDFWWHSGIFESQNNWAAVCGGSVGAILIYESPEDYEIARPKIETAMKSYLKGITEEGACVEGVTYWTYGFAFYILYQDLLKDTAYGQIYDDLGQQKVVNEAEFLLNMRLDDKDNIVSFSDSGNKFSWQIWLFYYLNKKYGTQLPSFDTSEITFIKFSWVLRAFLCFDPEIKPEPLKPKRTFYKEAHWFVDRNENYGFAVKGGNNNEEHNHNDLGSFIFATSGKQVLCDLGSSLYNAKMFSVKRYEIFNCSALGHSIPIINGKEQLQGSKYQAELSVSENIVKVDLTKAYPLELYKIQREFELDDNVVTLTDEIIGAESIIERFITEIEPKIEDGIIYLDNVKLDFRSSLGNKVEKAGYHTESMISHNRACSKNEGERTIYVIDITLSNNTEKFIMKISIE